MLLLLFAGAAPAATLAASEAASEAMERTIAPHPVTLAGQSATQLADGTWLVLGGASAGAAGNHAWLIDANGKTAAIPSTLHVARTGHTATLLPDGSVLVLGGVDSGGNTVGDAEIYSPAGATFTDVGSLGLLARSGQSATVLPDGRVLIAGGKGTNGALLKAELFDPQAQQVSGVVAPLSQARIGATSVLLTNGQVLLWGGTDAAGQLLANGELYDVGGQQFRAVPFATAQTLTQTFSLGGAPNVQGTLPQAEAANVPVKQRIMVAFSQRMAIPTLNAGTVTLIGPSGTVAVNPVPLDGGLLLFLTPTEELLPATSYTLFIQGASDQFGQKLPLAAVSFTTAVLNSSKASAAVAKATLSTTVAATPVSTTTDAASMTSTAAETAAVAAAVKAKATAAAASAAATTAASQSAAENELWVPGTGDYQGRWRRGNREVSKLHPPKNQDLAHVLYGYPALMKLTPADVARKKIPNVVPTASGVTGVAGQLLRLNGEPLVGATLSVGATHVFTDSNGEFLLEGLPSGHQILVIEGGTADSGDRHYGRYEYGVNLEAGRTKLLPFVIWMTRLNPQTVALTSPTQTDTVVTNEQIPGMELRIPAGMVIRDAAGKIVTEISMTAIPVDQAPFPLPHISVPVYFTIQPGGSHLEALDATKRRGAQLIYPNYPHAKAGTRMTFWDYDATGRGWFEYGKGTVTADGKQVMPDADVQVYEFSGAMITTFTPESQAPTAGPPCACGGIADPVDPATGLFVNDETDLTLPDVIPIRITRSYRQADDASRGFGIGTNLNYDVFLVGGYDTAHDKILPYSDLILPSGERIHFDRVSGDDGYTDAVFQSVAKQGPYYGAIIKWDTSYVGADWSVTLKDGTVEYFPGVGDGGGSARYAAMVGVRDAHGNTLQLIRTAANLTQVISPNGRNVYLTYDAQDRVTSVSDDLQRQTTYSYDGSGRLVTVTDPLGQSKHYTYGAQTLDGAHSLGGVTSTTNMLTIVDKNGNTKVSNVYDSNGRVIQQTYADGHTYQFAYTLLSATQTIVPPAFDTVIQTDATDERGTVTRFMFDGNGARTKVIQGVGLPIQQTITFNRNPTTNLLDSVTDALGRTTAYLYDSLGNQTQVTALPGTADAVGGKAVYDLTFSKPTSVTDANGNTTTMGYDSYGDLVSITDPLGHASTISYDGQGRPTMVQDALNHGYTLGYSGADLQSVVDALSQQTVIFTDLVGRVASVTDPLGNRIYTAHDALDRVTAITDPKGGVVHVNYDANSNVTSQVDQKNNSSAYTYDALDRQITATDALGHQSSMAYEPGGQVNSAVDNKGQITSMAYDGLGRLINIGYGATSANPTPVSTVALTWDMGNRLTKIVDSVSGTITRSYDKLDRMTSETTPQGTVSYTYDAGGRRVSMTAGAAPTVSYTYDAANRLLQIQQAAGMANSNSAQTVSFTYAPQNALFKMVYPNGVVGEYTYDVVNQLTGISYSSASGEKIGNFTYSYDAAGRRTTVGGSMAQTNPAYAISGSEFNANNQLTTWAGKALTYDANGNLTSDSVNTYVWDARDQLQSISGAVTANFQYDAFGRRISKTVGNFSTGYLYDGVNFVRETAGSVAGSTVTATLLTGLGVDDVFERQGSAGGHTLLTDALGSTIMTTDSSGSMVARYAYDAYGVTTQTGNDDNSQQYTGRENDQTGLYYYRARYYHPGMQRFISPDPMGWASGQTNDYAYVGGSPLSYSDPFGQSALGGVGSFFGGWGGRVLGGVGGEILFPAGGGVPGAVVGGQLGALGGRAIGEFLNDLIFTSTQNGDGKEEVCRVPRQSSKTLRRKWERGTGSKWPKDPDDDTRNQDVSHKVPLADGGTNDFENIEPKPRALHLQEHIDNGDFARWGARGTK